MTGQHKALRSGLAMIAPENVPPAPSRDSITQTRDIRKITPLMSDELRVFISRQTEGFQRATIFEVGLYATNLLTARHAEPAVRRLVEEMCEAIRREKAAALMALQAGGS